MPLGYIMWVCYLLVNNFGWAIIIFTILIKTAMFPLTLKQQKNMAKSQLFTPKVKEIQQKYRNNQEKMQEEMGKLQKEGYNPMGGCGTMLVTFLTLSPHSNEDDLKIYLDYLNDPNTLTIRTQRDIDSLTEEAKATAAIQEQVTIPEERGFDIDKEKSDIHFTKDGVMCKNGLTEEQWNRISALSDDTVAALADSKSRLSNQVKNALSMAKNANFVSLRQELAALRVYTDHKEAFSDIAITQESMNKLENLSNNMQFAGLDLGATPGFELPLILIPILSLIMSLAQMIISQIIQKKTNPDMPEQPGCAKFTLYIMPLFSLYIAFQVPAGVGFYWALNYLFGILQSLIVYKFWPTEKLKEQAKAELDKKNINITATATVVDVDEEGNEIKVSKKMSDMSAKEIKEYQRRKIEEARKADAEKYGDEEIPDLPPLDYDNEESGPENEDDKDGGKDDKNKKKK